MRWAEEETLTGYEMQWTVRHFLFNSDKWRKEISGNVQLSAGARAYAARKMDMWDRKAHGADKEFRAINVNYVSPM